MASCASQIGTVVLARITSCYPHGRHRGALLSDVCLDVRLGETSTCRNLINPKLSQMKINVPALHKLDPEPQLGVLLQRRSCDQVALVERD